MENRRNISLVAMALVSMFACGSVPAATLSYGADVGIGESDNVSLVPTNKVSQTIAIADVDFAVHELTRVLDVNAKGDFSFLDFLQGAYGSELIGRFDGSARIALLPEHLSWVLQDDFGQSQLDPFAPVTPGNRENVNYVSTGPDLDLRLGSTGFMDATARYARTQFEVSPFDSNRFQATVAFGLPISARSTVSLDGSSERVLFDNTLLNTDFDRSSVYGHYDLKGARTSAIASLGVTTVDQGGHSSSGPLIKLELSRVLSAASTLKLILGRDLTDATTGFANLASGAVSSNTTTLSAAGAAPAAVTSENYTVTYGSLAWEYVRNRTTLNLSGRWERDAYDGQPLLDLTRENADVSVERRLTEALSAQLRGSLYRTDYANVDSTERDALVGGGLTFRRGRGLEIRLRYDHVSRVVTGLGTGYTENRVFLTVGYRPRNQPLK